MIETDPSSKVEAAYRGGVVVSRMCGGINHEAGEQDPVPGEKGGPVPTPRRFSRHTRVRGQTEGDGEHLRSGTVLTGCEPPLDKRGPGDEPVGGALHGYRLLDREIILQLAQEQIPIEQWMRHENAKRPDNARTTERRSGNYRLNGSKAYHVLTIRLYHLAEQALGML